MRYGPYVARAVAQLSSWPALAAHDTPYGPAFSVGDIEILRLASSEQVRVRLSARAIRRLEPELRDCDQVRPCADGAWVSVIVEAEPDLDLLLALTSVAIKAHAW